MKIKIPVLVTRDDTWFAGNHFRPLWDLIPHTLDNEDVRQVTVTVDVDMNECFPPPVVVQGHAQMKEPDGPRKWETPPHQMITGKGPDQREVAYKLGLQEGIRWERENQLRDVAEAEERANDGD